MALITITVNSINLVLILLLELSVEINRIAIRFITNSVVKLSVENSIGIVVEILDVIVDGFPRIVTEIKLMIIMEMIRICKKIGISVSENEHL